VLLLDVVINGSPTGLIGNFSLLPGGILCATRAELIELGLRTDPAHASDDVVPLNEVVSLRYVYDERQQQVRITVEDAGRVPQVFNFSHRAGANISSSPEGWGAVLNYDLFSSFGGQTGLKLFGYGGSSFTFDARVFSPYGTFSQSGVSSRDADGNVRTQRFDSFYRYSDPARLMSVTIGDAVTGGLSWTRPIRIGGLQGQSNFSLRPDLVTMALPNIGGTAAVPSTVDVYVNNIRTLSQDVGAGPFSLTNIPAVTGAGNAELVIRDTTGRVTSINMPFYGSASLLAPGLTSWSLAAGLPRVSYGSPGDRYLPTPVGTATWRQGMTEWFTGEGHIEGGSGVINAGLGAAFKIANIAVATTSLAASRRGTDRGEQATFYFETKSYGVNISLNSQRTFGDYEDIASATARDENSALYSIGRASTTTTVPAANAVLSNPLIFDSARAPRALDRITMGGQLPFDLHASWGASFVHQHDASGNQTQLASASSSCSLRQNVSLFATVFKGFGRTSSGGAMFGLSFPLGGSTTASAIVSGEAGRTVPTLQASRSLDQSPGSVGWQAQVSQGATPYGQASVSYRARAMTVQVGANQNGQAYGGRIDVSGAVAAMNGDLFFADRIPDGFAVVDAGAPGVPVLYENRAAGTTNSRGLLLIPSLRSFERNSISIDPVNLPIDVEIETTREVAMPADRAGTLVSFKLRKDVAAARVIFVQSDGKFPPAGSTGRVDGGDPFVVGYDGQAFIHGLSRSNQVTIDLGGATCRAAFDFAAAPGEQVLIGAVVCH
jgi:outer membrane usher protein